MKLKTLLLPKRKIFIHYGKYVAFCNDVHVITVKLKVAGFRLHVSFKVIYLSDAFCQNWTLLTFFQNNQICRTQIQFLCRDNIWLGISAKFFFIISNSYELVESHNTLFGIIQPRKSEFEMVTALLIWTLYWLKTHIYNVCNIYGRFALPDMYPSLKKEATFTTWLLALECGNIPEQQPM